MMVGVGEEEEEEEVQEEEEEGFFKADAVNEEEVVAERVLPQAIWKSGT